MELKEFHREAIQKLLPSFSRKAGAKLLGNLTKAYILACNTALPCYAEFPLGKLYLPKLFSKSGKRKTGEEDMYLNIGADVLLRSSEIVGIFDLDTASMGADTKRFLKEAEKNKSLKHAGNELPKSFVVTKKGEVYLSQFSSQVLKNRRDDRI